MSTYERTQRTLDKTKCIKCNKFLRKLSGKKKVVNIENEAKDFSKIFGESIVIGDIICCKCMAQFRLHKHKEKLKLQNNPQENIYDNLNRSESSQTTVTSSQTSTEDQTIVFKSSSSKMDFQFTEMPFNRTVISHTYCCLCSGKTNLIVVPFEARMQVFQERRVFIPKGNRCCSNHLIKKRFFEEELQLIRIYSNRSMIEVIEIVKLLEYMSVKSNFEIKDKIGDFSLSEERIKTFTGLTWKNLIQLKKMMTSIRNSECRNILQAIVIFLFKLCSGNSNSMIAAILGLQYDQQVSMCSESVIKSFEKDILPIYFGFKAFSRNDLIQNHTSVMARKLYDIKEDQLVLICDGTYLQHEKSSNNEYQRKSFSVQKKMPLCKPFTICTTDGFIVDTLGPFYANQNDAQIMKIIMSDPNGLRSLLRKCDIFILDRGFRDVKQYLEEQGYQVLMPALKGQRSQLTTEESNESRRITKLRWPVEAVHGVIGQKYRLLHHKLDNKLLPKAGSYCRIACFLNNTFGKRFNSDVDLSDEIVAQIKSRASVENTLALEVETQRWSSRKLPFQPLISTHLLDFPEMTEKDLKIFFTGSYQLSQSISYLAEIMNQNNINLHYLKKKNDIIKVQIRSRHVNKKRYNCYIHYAPNTIGYNGILRYFCECANGRCTIGCCSHVAAIIYYLSHARYLSKIIRPAEILSRLFNVEEVNPVINDDSDED
ncbi:uncharacterized protein LOC113004570 [Solenopsis invicta]|uniref:uncharacterized protein LOC113004570 n=1 Tax=Solenopsis invicta TaxID=13686 RepID=UPI00193D4530|nr:uncharacterized protein LOC113004570 [Solenopsis invicta]